MGKADKEASSKVKNLFAIDWNVNPQAFIKKMQLDVEVSKKDMTELVALEGFTIFCKPGVGLFGSAEKKNIPALMEFILKFHETYGVPFFNDKGKPRITASTGMPPSIARALGFTKGEDKWEYVPTEEDGDKEETAKSDVDEAKKKASKEDKKATAKTEKPKEKEKKVKAKPAETEQEQPKKAAKAKSSAKVVRRNPEQFVELMVRTLEIVGAEYESSETPIFKMPIEEVLEHCGYARLSKDYMADVTRMLFDEHDVLVYTNDKAMHFIPSRSIVKAASKIKKNDVKQAQKSLDSEAE